MIKKFNEFIKEEEFDDSFVDVYSLLSKEDLEDQFLRLKEVLGCDVCVIDRDYYEDIYNAYIKILPSSSCLTKAKNKIRGELDQIKFQIENMYPVIVDINYVTDANDWGDVFDKYFLAKISPKYSI